MKKKAKASEEFVVGKHNIGWLYNFEQFKDDTFKTRPMPTFQKLSRSMTDAEIESELKPGISTLGDVLTFLDEAPEEYRDGYANLFYLPSCVVDVNWHAGDRGWLVGTWLRGDDRWGAGARVRSPATGPSTLSPGTSDTLTLESLDLRLERLEHWARQIAPPDL